MGIMDDMTLYALGYWMHESHPVRMESFCLNEIQRKNPCANCSDACPRGISVHEDAPDWGSCINCDLCVTACPTQAIRISGSRMDDMQSCLEASDGIVVFSCDRIEARGGAEMRVACLASLPWELVAMAGLDGRVVLRTSACKDCPHEELRQRTKELVASLRRFFGTDEFKRRILPRIPEGAAEVRVGAADRRRAFAGVAATVRRGATNLVKADGSEAIGSGEESSEPIGESEGSASGRSSGRLPEASHCRALLVEKLLSMPADERIAVSWPTLIEDGNCRGCGICGNMCPHHALSLRIPELDEGGVRAVASHGQALVHDASRCTQCGLCYMSCPNDNLGGWDELRTDVLPALREFPIEVVVCEKCGRPFKQRGEERRCPACSRLRFR